MKFRLKLGITWSQNFQCPFDWKGTSFSKIKNTPHKAKFFQISFKVWITIIQAFQMRYITFLYLKGVKRYQPSKFKGLYPPLFYKVNMRVFEFLELWRLVSFDLLKIQKCYILLLEGLNSGWNFESNLYYLYSRKRQINFSEKSSRFILKGLAFF